MNVEDQYPSTEDAFRGPPMKGAQDDLTLDILYGGRIRLERGHTTFDYILDVSFGVQKVCAIGSILAADGITSKDLNREMIGGILEDSLSSAAKEAIRLLNEKTIELYPDAVEFGVWSGPFEYLNQSHFVDKDWDAETHRWQVTREAQAKEAVLRVYDAVIVDRGGEVPVPTTTE